MIELPWDRRTVPHCVLEITQQYCLNVAVIAAGALILGAWYRAAP